MSKEELLFCPLGGSGQIGGNMNLYAYGKNENQKWILKTSTGNQFNSSNIIIAGGVGSFEPRKFSVKIVKNMRKNQFFIQ